MLRQHLVLFLALSSELIFAEWRSGSATGSYPGGRWFDSSFRNQCQHRLDPLAQLVEQLAVNQNVTGSSPVGVAIKKSTGLGAV